MLLKRTIDYIEHLGTLRRQPWLGYASAVVLCGAALWMRILLDDVLEGVPFLTFFPAIALVAFFFGWRPGLLAGVLGGVASVVFLFPGAPWLQGSASVIAIGFYAGVVLLIVFLTAALQRAVQYQAESTRQLAASNERLELRVHERTAALESVNEQLKVEIASHAETEAKVRQLQKMEAIGQLTGGVAHDFNNMLAIIIGSLDLARRSLHQNPDKAGLYVAHATEGARRAADLTARLLAFARQQPLEPRPVDANRLLANMSEMLKRTMGENIKVETVLSAGTWPMYADPGQVESAILNLCINSQYAMPYGGQLTLETMNSHLDEEYAAHTAEVLAGQYVQIAVTDTGVGMTPDVIARAFDPFYTTKPPGKGSGLGLSQVYGFVKQSGGHIKIYSEPGQGTTVRIYLPRYRGEQAASTGPSIRPAVAGRSAADKTVLVVEDDDGVRLTLVAGLAEIGYHVLEAGNVHDALDIARSDATIDLLLTDVVMPDMNGRALAEQVHTLRPGIKVLYTTGYTRNAVIHNGVLDADVALLQKPFTVDQLAARIAAVLAS